MTFLKRAPGTFILIGVNVFVFLLVFVKAGTFDQPDWTYALLDFGAEYNPFTLGGEWYRVFTHMFLHGHLIHLAVNMFALYSLGMQVEEAFGTRKFFVVYFISGIGAALLSLYWNLFQIGVGASGAIFGVYGFLLVALLIVSRTDREAIKSVLGNFLLFLVINIGFAEAFHADNAAHLGGLTTGALLSLMTYLSSRSFQTVKVDYLFVPAFVIIFFLLPRFQVRYYEFFESLLKADENATVRTNGYSDAQYLEHFRQNREAWDSVEMLLNQQGGLPSSLASDTSKLRKFIGYRKAENDFRLKILEQESYIYLDSLEIIGDSLNKPLRLDYYLPPRTRPKNEEGESISEPQASDDSLQVVKVWYDSNWNETPPPGHYYRVGTRDSKGRWQGPVRDYYRDGEVQMKGVYRDNKRDGVFIYYSDHHTYSSAGRYEKDMSVGKWQIFHHNGKLAREVYYGDEYRIQNVWDSLGNTLVINGNGRVVEYYLNGVVKSEGMVVDGREQGTWTGRFEDGSVHYVEEFQNGRLIRGRSRDPAGQTFTYDETIFFPRPESGFPRFYQYVQREVAKIRLPLSGSVRLGFYVNAKGVISELKVEEGLSNVADEHAKRILLNGPEWIPVMLHGYQRETGYAAVRIEFGETAPE